MRTMILFDLPMESNAQKKSYREFSKCLKENGFIMLQKSVYTKLSLDEHKAKRIILKLVPHLPPQGFVCSIQITEKQFCNIRFLLGTRMSEVIDSDSRVIVL